MYRKMHWPVNTQPNNEICFSIIGIYHCRHVIIIIICTIIIIIISPSSSPCIIIYCSRHVIIIIIICTIIIIIISPSSSPCIIIIISPLSSALSLSSIHTWCWLMVILWFFCRFISGIAWQENDQQKFNIFIFLISFFLPFTLYLLAQRSNNDSLPVCKLLEAVAQVSPSLGECYWKTLLSHLHLAPWFINSKKSLAGIPVVKVTQGAHC